METGTRGRVTCFNDPDGATQAHTWHGLMAGAQWAQWNPHRVRLTLCEDILQPIELYKAVENDVRDLQQFEIGGQTARSPTIHTYASFVSTGVFLHEVSTKP